MDERDGVEVPGGAGLLLHGIGHAWLAVPEGARGSYGGGLRCVAHGGLAAVVSPVLEPSRVAAPARAELLDYARVIHSIHDAADVLPMRFGGVLAGEAMVRAHLDEHRTDYLRALTRIAGCVELGVRALLPASKPPDAPAAAVAAPGQRSGAAYLEARRRRYSTDDLVRERGAALEQALLARVAPLCREHRAELSTPRAGEPALWSCFFLVPRDSVPAFRAAVSPAALGVDAELALSGPWPPFNFVA